MSSGGDIEPVPSDVARPCVTHAAGGSGAAGTLGRQKNKTRTFFFFENLFGSSSVAAVFEGPVDWL